jgi:hypothetical protein
MTDINHVELSGFIRIHDGDDLSSDEQLDWYPRGSVLVGPHATFNETSDAAVCDGEVLVAIRLMAQDAATPGWVKVRAEQTFVAGMVIKRAEGDWLDISPNGSAEIPVHFDSGRGDWAHGAAVVRNHVAA